MRITHVDHEFAGRRYLRCLREIGPWPESALGIETMPVIRCCAPWPVRVWRSVREFFSVLWEYRHSPITNAVRVAYGCAFRGLPF